MRFKCARRPASLPSSASAVNGFLGEGVASNFCIERREAWLGQAQPLLYSGFLAKVFGHSSGWACPSHASTTTHTAKNDTHLRRTVNASRVLHDFVWSVWCSSQDVEQTHLVAFLMRMTSLPSNSDHVHFSHLLPLIFV